MRNNLPIILFAIVLFTGCSKNQLLPGNGAATGNIKVNDLAAISVTKGSFIDIPVNTFGYNNRFPDIHEPWEQTSPKNYNAAYVLSEGNMVRFPGGTVANYWNFATGRMFLRKHAATGSEPWVDTGLMGDEGICKDIILNDQQELNSLADLKTVVASAHCDVAWVMNMMTPGKDYYASSGGWNRTINDHPGISHTTNPNDDWYKMLDDRYIRFANALHRAIDDNGLAVKYIELGNEQYWSADQSVYYSDVFPDGNSYAVACNYIAGRLKTDFGNSVKIAAVAAGLGGGTRLQGWNAAVVPNLNQSKVDAVTMHTYVDGAHVTTYTESSFQNSLGNWAQAQDDAFTADAAYTKVFTPGWPVWYTEIRANAGTADNTWANALLQDFSISYLLGSKNCNMYLQANFNDVIKGVSSVNTRALALQPAYQASHGAVKAAHLNFPGVAQLPNYSKAVVEGVIFQQPDGTNKCAVFNFTGSQQTLDMSTIYPAAASVVVSGWKDGLNADTGSSTTITEITDHTVSTGSVIIEPYSVSFIRKP